MNTKKDRTTRENKPVGQPNKTPFLYVLSPFPFLPLSFPFQNIQTESERESCKSNRTNNIKRIFRQCSENVKKEQPLLNKRANREIDKPCEAEGGEG